MRLSKTWTVAAKDFKIFRKKKSIIYSIVGFELFISIGFPLILRYGGARTGGIPAAALPGVIDSFSFWYVIGATLLPMSLAAYSLIGEKVQKSLEPLLATPTTDAEILAGKSIAAAAPALIATYIGATIFMVSVDRITHVKLGYMYFPNRNMAVILLLLVPLVIILSIGFNILISSRSSDIRSAQQLGALIALPLGAVYILSQSKVISLSVTNLLIMAAILAVLDVVVFYFAKALFQREEILTRWK